MAQVDKPSTVHIVDDDPAFRVSISRLLRALGYAVETYASAEALLKRPLGSGETGCIILDIKMPDMSGPDLQARLNGAARTLPIVFLTGYPDISTTVQVIKAGAEDLLTKPVAMETLLPVIEHALSRSREARDQLERLEHIRARVSRLSPRERQVFERVARGMTNKGVAREIGTTERTVKAHRHGLMEKLDVTTLAELVIAAERLGILESPTE